MNKQKTSLQSQINTLIANSRLSTSGQTSEQTPIGTKATINEGWKKFSSDILAFSTDDWGIYLPAGNFSIEYPSNWTLNGTVFFNSDDKKVAEFSPGIVALKSGQKCFDSSSSEGPKAELISKTDVTIGELQGVLKIEKQDLDSPTTEHWYSNSYCLASDEEAFVMSFYEYQLNSKDRSTFNKVISSLSLY